MKFRNLAPPAFLAVVHVAWREVAFAIEARDTDDDHVRYLSGAREHFDAAGHVHHVLPAVEQIEHRIRRRRGIVIGRQAHQNRAVFFQDRRRQRELPRDGEGRRILCAGGAAEADEGDQGADETAHASLDEPCRRSVRVAASRERRCRQRLAKSAPTIPQSYRAAVRKPAGILRRWCLKKFRYVGRMRRDRVIQLPPRNTFFSPKYGCEYSA